MNSIPPTTQQQVYEQSYSRVENDYGLPDRKIVDGQELKDKYILSIGAGMGSDVWYLSGQNRVIGLDYAISGLKVGASHGIAGIKGDLNHSLCLPFRTKTFDVVILKDILEHILEPLELMLEVHRILRDDGFIVISVPNHFYLPLRLRTLFGKGLVWKSIGHDHGRHYNDWDYMHIRFFTYHGFRKFLQAASFFAEKWFWDFGFLAHYQNPDMWLEPQIWKQTTGQPMSRKGKIGLTLILPLWRLFNFLFPYILRYKIVSLAPGLLCGGFYVRARKA